VAADNRSAVDNWSAAFSRIHVDVQRKLAEDGGEGDENKGPERLEVDEIQLVENLRLERRRVNVYQVLVDARVLFLEGQRFQ
jgi:hypothetical protein